MMELLEDAVSRCGWPLSSLLLRSSAMVESTKHPTITAGALCFLNTMNRGGPTCKRKIVTVWVGFVDMG